MIYSLEIRNEFTGNYERIATFASLEDSKKHGIEHFQHNYWRINHRDFTEEVIYIHNPLDVIVHEAASELLRISRRNRWNNSLHTAQRFLDRVAAGQRLNQRLFEEFEEAYFDFDFSSKPVNKINWLKEGF